MQVMSTPRAVDLDITSGCNLRCKYCSHFTSAGDVGVDLPKEEWLKFFEELNTCRVMKVCIEGGEPFYRQDLVQIIEGIVRNRLRFDIASNGTLISDEMAAFLASTQRCNGVQVSLDGPYSQIHDAFRGKGSFLKAIEGIKYLKKYNVSVLVRVTIHQENVYHLEEIARFLLEELNLASFSTNSASYMGFCRKNSTEIQLGISERTLAMQTLLKLTKKYNGRITARAGPLAEARDWLMMERSRCEGREGLPGRGYLIACGGLMTKIAVRADGVLIPCIQLSHIELGRINQDSLKEVWQNHPQLEFLRQRFNIPLSDFEFCRGCDYTPYCTGNCPALAFTLLGKENHPSPDACLRKYLEGGGRLPDERA